ncbi:MAG: MGMT family protein, partial [Candidatus Kryptoniota bacterium]
MVKTIPKGRVASYGQIARLCDLGRQARLVGYALHNLKPNSRVPWHRVVNSKGTISFPKHTGAYKLQKTLLEKEGIVFKGGKIDLSKYGVAALAVSSPAARMLKSKIPHRVAQYLR